MNKQKPTYIIAEIGINHNGDIDTAIKLIELAKHAGCDAVKFQKRTPDICVPDHQKDMLRDTPWGTMRYIDYKHRIEFGPNEYKTIDTVCKRLGIEWSASVWDRPSLEFILDFDVPWIKIPSAHVTNEDLVVSACDSNKRIIVSTGMCSQYEVDRAIDMLLHHGNPDERHCIMHTNSSYPSKVEDLNLSYIQHLVTLANGRLDVGYSGHEFGIIPTIGSIYLGATMIERHITLDKSMWGTDQQSSLGPKQLHELVDGIRELETAYGSDGDGSRIITESEVSIRKKLRGV